MKRILGIILVAAMLFAMIPAVAAADTQTEGESAEPVSVTYSFTNGGRSDVPDGWLERVVKTTDAETGTSTYSFLWNEKYKNFPTDSENPGDYWAYLGTNAATSVGKINASTGIGSQVSISTYLGVNQCSWTALRIKVPKTAEYSIEAITAYKYKNASTSMSISIAEFTDELRTIFTEGNTATYGTAGENSNTYGTRTGAKDYAALGIADKMTLLGKANIRLAEGSVGYATVLSADITDAGTALLNADTEYLLVLHTGDNRATTITTLTLTEVEDENAGGGEEEIPVARNQEYVFSAYVTAGSGYNTTGYDDFSKIDETSGTDDWAITAYGAHNEGKPALTQLSATELKFYANKTYYGTDSDISNKAVIALDVEEEGTYDISVTTNATNYGAEADVYILSEKELTETYASYLSEGKVTTALFRELPIQGRISSVGASGTIVSDLGTKKLSGGTNYMLFHIMSDNPKTINSGNNNQCINLTKINLNLTDSVAEEESATAITGKVSFASGADITLNGKAYSANTIASIDAGSTVTVKADETAGNFAGWIRGRIDSGVYVSTDAEYTFEIMSNTYLTPVYSKAPSADGQIVEFWNANGAYIGNSEVADGSAAAPVATLTGHTFAEWLLSESTALPLAEGKVDVSAISDAIIRAVASFVTRESVGANAPENADVEDTKITLDRVLVNGVAQTKNFGDKIVCTDTGAVTAWLRDGKIVSYDPEYTYYIWDATNIYSTYVKNIEKKPLVVIDSKSIDGAYMIEYDKGNADAVVEAGILFGSTSGIVISSTDGSKAASQKNTSHGQFCASPNGGEQYARGYLIYEKNGAKYIIYTDAISIGQ